LNIADGVAANRERNRARPCACRHRRRQVAGGVQIRFGTYFDVLGIPIV
jgi:hypothetical protein